MSIAKEILEKIQKNIDSSDVKQEFSKKGEILEIKDGVATLSGLENVMFSEVVEFENGLKGLVLDLSEDAVGALILGDYSLLKQGDVVKGTGKILSVGVGENFLGRVVDGLGNPIDGLGEISFEEMYPVERVASGVITRKEVNVPLETGIKSIDAMTPIGRGQRELIIGDRQTGKTTIALDTILNQAGKDVYCIYVAIGQKESKVRQIAQTLKEKGALDYTIIVSASTSMPAVVQYLAPYVGTALGEYFMFNGKDALIIYDDLSKHAVAYREVSLLIRRPPGREAYPGDVFYLHSKLLERSARLEPAFGGGSLTSLPIIETLAGDVSAYIPTNVISITDGQIFLETDLFNSGIRPAINSGLSVSRVGGSAQTKIMKSIAGKLRLELATFRELASFAQFASDLDLDTQKKLERGKRLVEMLKQGPNQPIGFFKQVVLIYAGINGFLDNINVDKIRDFEKSLYAKLDSSHINLANMIKEQKMLNLDIEAEIKNLLNELTDEFKK